MPPVSGTSAVVASFAICQSRVATHTWNETDVWLHSAAEVYFQLLWLRLHSLSVQSCNPHLERDRCLAALRC